MGPTAGSLWSTDAAVRPPIIVACPSTATSLGQSPAVKYRNQHVETLLLKELFELPELSIGNLEDHRETGSEWFGETVVTTRADASEDPEYGWKDVPTLPSPGWSEADIHRPGSEAIITPASAVASVRSAPSAGSTF